MNRRQFLSMAGAFAGSTGAAFAFPRRASSSSIRALVVVDLDGGNDGLNTVIPLSDPLYRACRPSLAISSDRALTIDEHTALHPSLLPLLSAWRAQEWAIVQGVGFEAPHRSHYRSRQIWETASEAIEYRNDGWLERVSQPVAIDPAARSFVTSCEGAARMIAARRADVVRLTLHGFDTHEYQLRRHALLLTQFAEGIALLRTRLIASGDWERTLVMTRSDFGRSARENAAGGTEHGLAAPHFLMGGSVRGGLLGMPPRLDDIGGHGGVPVDIDFRRLYATALAHLDVTPTRNARFQPLPLPLLRV